MIFKRKSDRDSVFQREKQEVCLMFQVAGWGKEGSEKSRFEVLSVGKPERSF